MEVIWKEVKGYKGFYEVSSLGEVRGLAREMKHPTKAGYVKIKPCVLKPHTDKGGYLNVNLWKAGKSKRHRIHQLVAIAFLDHTPCKHILVVNHKDFNRQNNNVDNLEITTSRKNTNQKHLPSSSKYTGVKRDRHKWVAAIWINGKQIYLGIYDNELAASLAYETALKETLC